MWSDGSWTSMNEIRGPRKWGTPGVGDVDLAGRDRRAVERGAEAARSWRRTAVTEPLARSRPRGSRSPA